jgi:hypothetical protein
MSLHYDYACSDITAIMHLDVMQMSGGDQLGFVMDIFLCFVAGTHPRQSVVHIQEVDYVVLRHLGVRLHTSTINIPKKDYLHSVHLSFVSNYGTFVVWLYGIWIL